MKLTVIGRNPQEAEILLSSQYVSDYHAELIQLINGDMYIVDKSTNGTFLNGNKLTPGKEVQVRRGDNIMFADQPLDWTVVPELRQPDDVKLIKCIGSHYMNDIKIQGAAVSRFHAVITQKNNGKWYITDYSKNGTIVAGNRLIKGRPVELRRGQDISCAGVPIKNPVSHSGILAPILIGIAAVFACVGLFLGILIYNKTYSNSELYQMYNQSVGFMYCSYHFKVECGTLDISNLPDPDSYVQGKFTRTMYDKFIIDDDIHPYNNENSMEYTATGFFVGKYGHLISNRHVACPWETTKLTASSTITIIAAAEDFYKEKLTKLYQMGYAKALPYISQVKVTGVLDRQYVIPNGEYFSADNAYDCYVDAISDTEDEDLAIFKIRKSNFAGKSIPIRKIKAREPKIGKEIFTIGFPFGFGLLEDIEKTQIQANSDGGSITRNDGKNTFGFSATSYQGASGSPVFDRNGYLIGVVSRKLPFQGFNWAVRSEVLEKLITSSEIK